MSLLITFSMLKTVRSSLSIPCRYLVGRMAPMDDHLAVFVRSLAEMNSNMRLFTFLHFSLTPKVFPRFWLEAQWLFTELPEDGDANWRNVQEHLLK